jgi:two-component system, NarL family, response regulator
MQPISLLIADDHSVVREALRSLLSSKPDIEVVGEAATGAAAVELFDALLPDVALLDLRMPLLDGIEATRQIRRGHADARILILSTYEGVEDVFRAMQSGAMGYVPKAASSDDLVSALRTVMTGKQWIPDRLKAGLADRGHTVSLTERERRALEYVASGESNKEIAEILGITEHTAKWHLKSILKKLGARDRTEAVRIALERGIIHLPGY